jgi:hypothetical protein
MGKQSKRIRNRIGPIGPSEVPIGVHPHFDSSFVPIQMPPFIRELEVAKQFEKMVSDGLLTKWELGRRGTNISSRFVTFWGADDMLTSPLSEDNDFEPLCQVHLVRATQLLFQEAKREEIYNRLPTEYRSTTGCE